nr:hypothetical protein [uncultured Prevotella sp.]
MTIIESKIIGKESQETCEDGIVVTDQFISIVDGSTSKTPMRISREMKNGRYCMLIISEFIRQLKPETTLTEFCQGVTECVRQHYPAQLLTHLASHPEDRMTASAIVYSHYRNEIWMVGDCQGIVNGKLWENGKPYEERIALKRKALILQGVSPDEARKAIVPDLIQAMKEGQNKTYAVIDGFPIFQKGVKVIPCPRTAGSEIVLASDGYPFLRDTFQESEHLLATQLEKDPQNISSFLATKGLKTGYKSFDDRSYIRFQV